MFADYARKWGTNGIVIDSNGLNYQTQDDTFDVEYGTDGTALHIVYSGATNGWIPIEDDTVDDVPSKGNEEGIFGFGYATLSMTNLVSNAGVVSSDVTGVGTGRGYLAACEYGGDEEGTGKKGIFAYGATSGGYDLVSMSNLVSNAGVVATDVTGVGTARRGPAACSYGEDKGIFGYGEISGSKVSMTNLVSNAGVVGTDVTGVGTVRRYPAACEYGADKGIFGYGDGGGGGVVYSMTNLVSNAGVVATDTTGVGTARGYLGATQYGGDKCIFGYGYDGDSGVSMTNLVSNAGVVASDVTGVGTARHILAATQYGGDKGIFGYGAGPVSMTNLVSNAGVVATDTTGVGTARSAIAACSFN
jgi:hypothetical protein